jgi:serine/threonine protein kinase
MMTQEEFRNRYRFDPNRDYIGGGGFGKVYRAYDFVKRHYVAIKVSEVKHEWKHFTLQREVEIVNKMPHHQNVARYDSCHRFDMGMVGTMDFAVLKYYENGNFEQFLKKHQLSDLETEQVIRGILEGIVFLHKNRIIHRDLKSQNILIDREDGIWVPKITDFGLSRQVTQDSTGTNSVVGISFAYAAPEQIQNRPIQQNVDLWAAGVIIYRMIAGELPFKSSEKTEDRDNTQSQMELCRKITHGELPTKLKTLPEPYKRLISNCLVVDTKKRVQQAEDLLHLLDTYTPPSQHAPADIAHVAAPTPSEPTTVWTAGSGQSLEQSLPKVPTETATTVLAPKSVGKPTPSANAAEQPTLLKELFDNSVEKPTVLKDHLDKPTILKDDLDKPTVLKDNLGASAQMPTVLKDDLDKPTVLKDNFGTSAQIPTVLKDDFDKPTVLKDNFGTSAQMPTVLKDDLDKPTVLKDNSAAKPTVLKDDFDKATILKDNLDKATILKNDLDKPTVLKDNFGISAEQPTVMKNDFDQPTVLKEQDAPTRILTPIPKTVEQPDDFKKQLKLWGGIAAVVCLFGVIFGYFVAQKRGGTITQTAPPILDTSAQKTETAQVTVPEILDTTAVAVATTTIAPATTVASTVTPAKKTEKVPKSTKSTNYANSAAQTLPDNSIVTIPTSGPATPTKSTTTEPAVKVELPKTETKELASKIDNLDKFYKTSLIKELQRLGTDKTLGIGKEKSWSMVFIIESNGSTKKDSERLYCDKCNEAEKNKLSPYLKQSMEFGFPVPLQAGKPVAFKLKIDMVNGTPDLKVF